MFYGTHNLSQVSYSFTQFSYEKTLTTWGPQGAQNKNLALRCIKGE